MSRSSRRGPWLPEEDATLLLLVRTQGPNNWVRISQHMQHRSPKQCRERFHQNLKPTLNHESISAQEGEMIEQLVQDMGKRWAEIARRLGNRSDNAVKNWWNGSMNRRKRSTVQQGGASKIVGHRTQPIPVSLHPLRQHLHLPEHPNPDSLPVPPLFHRHGLSAPNILEQGHRYNALLQQQRDPMLSQPHHQPFSFPPRDQPSGSPNPLSRSSSLLSPEVTTLPRLHTWPSHSSEYQLAPLNCTEPPAPSPAATEVSRTSSHPPAPSLISDSQSNCSISPRTVISPRPGMSASKTQSMEVWPQLPRRHSTDKDVNEEGERVGMRRYDDDLRSYRSTGAQDDGREHYLSSPGLPLPSLLPDLHQPGHELFSAGARAHDEQASSPPQNLKDFRMTVSNLLK